MSLAIRGSTARTLARWCHYSLVNRTSAGVPLTISRQYTTPLNQLTEPIQCYVSKSDDPFTNLAIEEWLLRHGDPHSYILYLWRNRPCVVIGRNQNPWKECNLDAMHQYGVDLVRRQSGGGTVYHDLGNSLYTIVMPRKKFVRRISAELVARALHMIDIPAQVNERNDIVIDNLKISGSAYKITGERAYHHGTMLIHSDLTTLSECLKNDKPHMISKGVESVRSPVTKLGEHSLTVDHDAFCQAVLYEFQRTFGLPGARPLDLVPIDNQTAASHPLISKYLASYRSWDWIYGQTPLFTNAWKPSYPWATLDISIASKHGRITQFEINSLPAGALPQNISQDLRDSILTHPYSTETIEQAFRTYRNLKQESMRDPVIIERIRQLELEVIRHL
ncbi:hypothetical protein IWQ62_000794 [Dispira parvispora]|uniref:Putative lipoate-protein ligase A n=1 Tax=Dispira parvispora TaxID=1520584 RepID=A0A9W8AZC7_9FUNG|nr:hypothetical protein IWQ62_000794 [Dispira parvispora]